MKFRTLIVVLILALLFGLGFYEIRKRTSLPPDFPSRTLVSTDAEVTIEIPAGATGSEIAKILFDKHVIKSSRAYFRTAVSERKSDKVAPGAHRVSLSISAIQALDQLLDPARIPNLIKISEGAWQSEIADSMRKYGFSSQEIALGFRELNLPAGFKRAEGLLYPAQYTFPSGTTAAKALQTMVNRFKSEKTGQEILQAQGKYSPLELLTIASIVQAEGDTADFSMVARTIFNRLKISMPLQLDSTVHYIKRVRGQIFLSTSSTLINSPYNTYKHYGLPPTPIGNPGVDAMAAALKPSVGDWLYFITVAPRDTRFTASSDEFAQWKTLYEKNRKAGLFK